MKYVHVILMFIFFLVVNSAQAMLSSSTSGTKNISSPSHAAECPCVTCLNQSLNALADIKLQLAGLINQNTINKKGLNISPLSENQRVKVCYLIKEIEELSKNLKVFQKDFNPKEIKKSKKKEMRDMLKEDTFIFETQNGVHPDYENEELGHLKNPAMLKLGFLGSTAIFSRDF